MYLTQVNSIIQILSTQVSPNQALCRGVVSEPAGEG